MAVILKSTVILVILSYGYTSTTQNDILNTIEGGMQDLSRFEEIPPSLEAAIQNVINIKDKALSDIVCKSCHTVVKQIIAYRRSGANKKSMIKYLTKLCIIFEDWGDVGCEGMVDIVTDSLLYMIDNRKSITPERVCAIALQSHKCEDPGASNWEIPLPPYASEDTVTKTENSDSSTINILHLTDFHYDPLYANGSNAVCEEPLCCQTGVPSKPENAAGYWGDYNVCDMPRRTIENVLQNIKARHMNDLDIVYFTGDIVSHRSWSTSRESNSDTFKALYGMFADAFQGKSVFPILGNHESHPTDFFSPPEVTKDGLSTQWLFEMAAETWSRWLPESSRATIRKGGYYTVLASSGFRIIALNSNVCFTSNMWLFYEDKDPYGQLAWLVEELHKAEQRKEKVHILSHIPPGEVLCHRQWSNQYRKIVNRFAATISAQFNGHTHMDEFRVFYNPENSSQVINVAFNGGGFTTFVGFNSNYKIYQVQTSTAFVEDYDDYVFDLAKANYNSKPEWNKLYSFKQAYNLPDLSPKSLDMLLGRMSEDEALLGQYYRFLVKNSAVKIQEGCDTKCLKQLLCYITAVETDLSVDC